MSGEKSAEDRCEGGDWTLRERAFLRVFSSLGSLVMRALGATWRVRWVGREHTATLKRNGHNWIYAFWHGGLLALIYSHRRQGIKVLVSTHRDGELVSRVICKLGFEAVRGSTTRGGGRALFALARLRDGAPIGVAPDGPRGPSRHVHPGVIYLAQRSGLPIVPLTSAATPCWKAGSWDGFAIPLPFSSCAIGYGEPMWVPRDAREGDLEKCCHELEERLNELQGRLDRMASRRGGD